MDTYKSAAGAAESLCKACSNESTTVGHEGQLDASSCVCRVGYYGPAGGESCVRCPVHSSTFLELEMEAS